MCGIVGCAGGRAAEEVYGGLLKLEYRGYDSAGISALGEGVIKTVKHSGRVARLSGDIVGLTGNFAIGHTRWATHGEATDANAHPHVYGDFSVVHNGIIENYAELKEECVARGEVFLSQTDSEVVAHLLNFYYGGECRGDLLGAVRRTLSRLRGSYALAILCREFDGIVAAKYKSSVIIGYGDGENFVASDIPALNGRAKSICFPEDGDVALITAEEVTVYDKNTERAERPNLPVADCDFSDGLGDCPHYMLKEMRENARTVIDTALSFTDGAFGAVKSLLSRADKIIVVGCGTAYNSALIAKRLLEKTYACPCTAEIASELRYEPPKITRNSLVIAVSQSGETADTVEAAKILKSAGAKVVAVTNVGYSAITRVADLVVPVRAGSEICVAATKSYIGQLACFYLMADSRGRGECTDELCLISDKIKKVISDGEYAATIANSCAKSTAVFFLGRGVDYDVAIEGSLKLKEVSYIFSDAYPAGELKHGTLALVDESVLAVVLICDKNLAEKSENAVEQVISRRGKVAVITTLSEVAERLKDRAFVWLLPNVSSRFSPFLTATALQLVAYRTALLRGHNPDKPRNLAKSVTVE